MEDSLLTEETDTSKVSSDDNNDLPPPEGLLRRVSTFGAYTTTVITEKTNKIQRSISTLIDKLDPDAKITRALIEDYLKHSETGPDGSLPPGFGISKSFWKLTCYSILVAILLGLLAVGLQNVIEKVPTKWNTCDYDNDISCGDYYAGKKYWILVLLGTALITSSLRYFTDYPEQIPGFYKELRTLHNEPKWVPLSFLLSAISIGGGANLGPEQALGNVGAGLCNYILELFPDMFETKKEKNLFFLSGMSGVLGCLFPCPLLGATMVAEIADSPGTYVEHMTLYSISSIAAFTTFYCISGYSFIDHLSDGSAIIGIDWLFEGGYKDSQVFTGVIFGIISGVLGLFILIIIGIAKQILARLRDRLKGNKFLKEIVPAVVAAVTIGTINWVLPLTTGNGLLVTTYIVKYGAGGESDNEELVAVNILIWTALARAFTLGLSMSCGFVGGFVYPILTIGVLVGSIVHRWFDYLPMGLCISCFTVSIASSVVPTPITMTLLSTMLFFLGAYQTVPVFVSVITSYFVLGGTGLFKRLQERGENEKDASDDKNTGVAEQERLVLSIREDDDGYSTDKYRGSTSKFRSDN